MREVLNISLPGVMVKEVKKEVKKGHFASNSEFIRHLIRLWNTNKLAQELKNDRKDFDSGKGIKLRSLKDLM
ncbi:hypothetical protein KAJ61_00465 [Candidatus Parcubacteria bacterium]|nr:hypothetical protein [Candidatus Parcubacteria bacterium]